MNFFFYFLVSIFLKTNLVFGKKIEPDFFLYACESIDLTKNQETIVIFRDHTGLMVIEYCQDSECHQFFPAEAFKEKNIQKFFAQFPEPIEIGIQKSWKNQKSSLQFRNTIKAMHCSPI